MAPTRLATRLKSALYGAGSTVSRWIARSFSHGRMGPLVADEIRRRSWARPITTEIRGSRVSFHAPSEVADWRIRTAATKEPDMIDWIDRIPHGSVLWDVGANVGIFTVYAARARHLRVVACEPSIFNLETLVRNLALNDVTHLVSVMPLPISDRDDAAILEYSSTDVGGAFVEFRSGADGRPSVVAHPTLCCSLDTLVARFKLPAPTHLKIDVDGAEVAVLKGAANALSHVQQVMVETAAGPHGDPIRDLLRGTGFEFVRRAASPLATDPRYSTLANEQWDRRG